MAELKMLRFSLGVVRNENIRGTEQVEIKYERQDRGGMVMYGGKMMGTLGEVCRGWNCQERGNL